jgi:MFS family permease
MTSDLGWSRGSYSAVQTITTAGSGVFGLFIGTILDRRGPRMLMLVGAVVAGAAVLATAFVQEFWQFLLLRGVGQTFGFALCGGLVVNVTVSKWFVARRGTAIAMASIGISLGGVLMAPLIGWWISAFGWREAWAILGVMTWVLILPAAFVMRRSPEDFGLLPDGGPPAVRAGAAAKSAPKVSRTVVSEEQWTRAQAIRTRALWLIIIGYGLATLGLGAMILHMIPFLTDEGFTKRSATALLSLFAWVSLLSKFAWGPLMDRVHARYLSVVGFALSGAAIAAFIFAARTESVLPVALVLAAYGLGMGGTAPLQETVWASYFGRAHLGSIRSVAMPFSIFFSAGGPLIGGLLYEQTGDYTLPFLVFAATCALGGVMLLAARPPRFPATESATAVAAEPVVAPSRAP